MDEKLAWLSLIANRRGVRHGIDLNDGLELGINEARLYCNLIRSYLTFLISEHERLRR